MNIKTSSVSDFFAPDGIDIDRAAEELDAIAADKKRQYEQRLSSMKVELETQTRRLAAWRERHAADLALVEQAPPGSQRLKANIAVAESMEQVARLEARVEHITSELSAQRKVKQ